MKTLVQKFSNSTATQIGRVRIGDVDISIGCKNELILGLVNGYKIVDAGLYDDFIPKISPIIARVIAKIYRDKWKEVNGPLVFYNEDWDTDGLYPSKNLLDRILFYLKKHLDEEAIQVIPKPQDLIFLQKEELPEPSLNFRTLANDLKNYGTKIESLSLYLERSADLAAILTKRQLISTMYGAEATQKVLDDIRNKVILLRPELSGLSALVNISLKSIQRLAYRLEKNLLNNENEKIFASTVLIPNITDNYEKIKSYAIKMVITLAPLVYIDEVFKTYVQYPASWFLPTNTIEDLNESYDVLIDFLSAIPIIEKNVMDSLNLLKVRNLLKEFT